MAHASEATIHEFSRLQRVWLWLKAVDERLHIDPVEQALADLRRKISALEESVSRLNSRITSESEDGQ